VQLFGATGTGALLSSTITIFSAVHASVAAVNPYLAGNEIAVSPADGGAHDGDPAYTRTGTAYLRVLDAGDCAGLSQLSLSGGATRPITDGAFLGYLTLPGGSTQGTRTFQVTVQDHAGNSATFPSASQPFSMIYDATPPVLDSSQNPALTAPLSATSVLVRLAFDHIAVSDNLYGIRENLPAGRQFWGVWLASSMSASADPASLAWVPIHVAQPGSSFSVQWSLFSGLGLSDLHNHPGSYYVYAKFLDGAGNPSSATLASAAITLLPGYQVPTISLPLLKH